MVTLLVTIEVDGRVSLPVVLESAGKLFDQSALAAVAAWRFEPARAAGVPVASRVRVNVGFTPPAEPVPPLSTPLGQSTAGAPEATAPSLSASPEPPTAEVDVHGERRARSEERSASDFSLHEDVLRAAPRSSGAEVLRAVPGLHPSAAEGLAVAHGYALRGFDAEHGQDIEFKVGGLPINLPSHIHGQGYADLGFLIAETVHAVRATEGLLDPRQGDFAVAGSIDIDLGVEEERRGTLLRAGYGSFGTARAVALWAPKEQHRDTFGAVELTTTDGFGENRAGTRGSAILQRRFGDDELSARAVLVLYGARADLAGVLREDDVERGFVCRLCVYPYPTAEAQSAAAQRAMLGVFVDSFEQDGSNAELGAWLGSDRFHLRENLTGFQETSQTLAGVAGRGDLIEQLNDTRSFGLTARRRSAVARPTTWLLGAFELGLDGRSDRIEQSQNLIDAAVRNELWDRRVDASVRGLDLGLWGDAELSLFGRLRVNVGVRADLLAYDVADRLSNLAPLSRPRDRSLPGYDRSALGVAVGPRASVAYRPLEWLALLSSYGEGYRSPQARTLEDAETAPFARVRSTDVGARLDLEERLQLTVAGYATWLSDDAAFDAREGRLERIGATTRRGAVVHAVTRPMKGALLALSTTFVDAVLLEPPPPSAEQPTPPFVSGQRLPFVAPLLLRADASLERTLLSKLPYGGLVGRASVGVSFLSSRPLPYDEYADPWLSLDTSTALRLGALELEVQVFNALDAEYAAAEYVHGSTWDPDAPRSRVPSRHFSAAAPRSWLFNLGVTL